MLNTDLCHHFTVNADKIFKYGLILMILTRTNRYAIDPGMVYL
jgi:hypothetical protein